MHKASLVLVLCLATVAYAQHNFSRTFTVDPSGNADFTTIQAAINAIMPANPAVQQTILIYPGTYAEAVTLGAARDHVDLRGVDRDAVIISVPMDSDGITIQGNGVRNNTFRNLTIMADDDTVGEGRGIVIKNNGGADPTDIGISSVTIQIDGANSDAIVLDDRTHRIEISDVSILGAAQDNISGIRVTGGTVAIPSTALSVFNVTMILDGCGAKGILVEDQITDMTITGLVVRKPAFGGRGVSAGLATDLTLDGCDILARDGDGLIPGPNTVVRNSSIVVRKSYGSDAGCGSSGDDKPAITVGDIDGLRIDSCYLEGRFAGIKIGTGASDVVIVASDVRGGVAGVVIDGASDVSLINCRIAADSALGEDVSLPIKEHYGLHILNTTSGLSVASSAISARSTTARDALGIFVEDAPTDQPVQILDCSVSALATNAATGVARGVQSDATDGVALIGGSVEATDGDERETDVFDVYSASTSSVRVRASGTQFSRWKGGIGAAVGQDVTVLRVVNIPSAGAATVLSAHSLIGVEQEITSNITDPEAFRVLSVTGNQAIMNKSVIIIGLDWALRPIADSITLSGTATVNGVKAFRFIDKIILPAQTIGSQTVSVGTTEVIGLHAPISEPADLLQIGRKSSLGTFYAIQSSVPLPDVQRGTVDISTLNPANNDSIEFTYRASK